jgi:formylglycine-generating enzyme required for sulfatase activity
MFFRTYVAQPEGDVTGEDDPATVSDFRLDKYDVTVGRYRQFRRAYDAGWRPTTGSGKHVHLNGGQGVLDITVSTAVAAVYEAGWLPELSEGTPMTDVKDYCTGSSATWTEQPGPNENLPMNCSTWSQAYAFCIWDGGFLPTEAEWAYAAAGGSEQRLYPWGSAGIDIRHAIWGDSDDMCNYPQQGGPCRGAENIAPVGYTTEGAGRWGQYDLVGNLRQWTLDWWDGAHLTLGFATPVNCVDCGAMTEPAAAREPGVGPGGRVERGGFFGDPPGFLLPAHRFYLDPFLRAYFSGIRCARSP